MRAEVAAAGIDKPAVVAATKADAADEAALRRLRTAVSDVEVVPVSILDDDSLDRVREAIWALTGLIRIHLRRGDETDGEPLALEPGAAVRDVVDAIHHELGATCVGARIWPVGKVRRTAGRARSPRR